MNEKTKHNTSSPILSSTPKNSSSGLLIFIILLMFVSFLWFVAMGMHKLNTLMRDSGPIKQGIVNFFEEEFKDFAKTVDQISPEDAQSKITGEATTHYQTGWDYYKNKEYTLAISEFKKVIALNPTEARAYNNIGLCYYDMGSRDKAIEFWEKANQVDPTHYKSLNNIGAVYTDWFFELEKEGKVDLEKLKTATSYLKRSIAIEPNYNFSRETYGRVNAVFAIYSPDKKAEYEKIAEENLKKAIELNYSRPEPHGFLAILYYNQKRFAESLLELRIYKQLGGTDEYILLLLENMEN